MPKRTKGHKPNSLAQSKRVWTNQLARDESIKRRLAQRGKEAESELPEYAEGINRLVGPKRDKRVKETINTLLKERQKTENNNTRKAGTKRNISTTPSPIHTDYSTNNERWIEPGPEKIQSFRQHLVEVEGPKKNSDIFEATRTAMREQASKRNAETKSRSQKRAKKQSRPEPEPGLFENLFGKILDRISKLKGI